jgi:hypothetical protein
MLKSSIQEYDKYSAEYNEWLSRFKAEFPSEKTQATVHKPTTHKEVDITGIGSITGTITAVAIAATVIGAFLILRETKS